MKTFVCDYHLNDPTTFLHHLKIKFEVRMREYSPWGTKMHFPCFTWTGSWFFNTVYEFKISKDRPMSLWRLKCLNLLRNGSNRHWFWKPENRRFYRINVIWPRDRRHCRWCPYALFCGSRLTLLKKMYRDSGTSFFTVFRLSRKERCIEICAFFARKSPEMLISLTF